MTLMKIVHINIFSEDNSDENSNTINENGNNEVMVTTMVIVYINVLVKVIMMIKVIVMIKVVIVKVKMDRHYLHNQFGLPVLERNIQTKPIPN